MIRIGVDVGGTKIEAIAIDAEGRELARRRIPSPAHDYATVVEAVRVLVVRLEAELGVRARVGVGTPGAISAATGTIKNANSTRLNGHPFDADLSRALEREVRVENDANCFVLSEAADGAGAGHRLVFGAILGTGVGGGIVLDGKPWTGPNAIAGEWGHNEMPSRTEAGLPDLACYCGRRRCIETYLSGPGLAADHARALHAVRTGAPAAAREGRRTGSADRPRAALDDAAAPPIHAAASPDARQVAVLARQGDAHAQAALARYANRLAGALATVINVLDPDLVVLGGGVSNLDELYGALPALLERHVFSDRCTTRVVKNRHGDSSGVRGAAWLWPA
jgi:fructokinase